ncbi:MAG: phospholipase D-like domain-containing protein [Cellulomonadaceae bacterium]|nr:phospholipase D-like domain-containing protein [Cellulomonadaceae bacterium]
MKPQRPGTETQVRLLVGMAMPPERNLMESLERREAEVTASRAARCVEAAVADFARQLTWGTPTKTDHQGLRQLQDDLESGLLAVRFAWAENLHAKLYVAHRDGDPSAVGPKAVVGSANFTMAGLLHQGELSLEESDEQTTRPLARWFDDRWTDDYSIDVTKRLIQVLAESWIRENQPRPYHVYLRLAYELSEDARRGLTLDIPAEIRRILYPYQESAVRVATRKLEREGITVIGDVVGLGKTLTGTAIAATFGESVLVIAPKNLTDMWQEHLRRFDIPGRVLSLSMVTKVLPDLKRFGLVMIDESHNLRNKSRQAWDAIHTYVTENDSQVVLLTATMFNAYHGDIGGQLGLKLASDQSLLMRPEKHIAKVGAQAVAMKTGGPLDTLEAFSLSAENEDWQRLLDKYLVRRLRKAIEATYGTPIPGTDRVLIEFEGKPPFSFPKRKPRPLSYPGGDSDPNDRVANKEVFDALRSLTYARYQLGSYLRPGVTPQDDDERDIVDDLITSKTSAAGFIRTTAYKRLTSSAHAFILTLRRMVSRNMLLAYALENNRPVPLGSFADAFLALDYDGDAADAGMDDDSLFPGPVGPQHVYDALWAKKPAGVRWARPALFDTEAVLVGVAADTTILQQLLDEYGTWDPAEDTKLQALADLIEALPQGGKVLVFSEYKDTIEYLAENLPTLQNSKGQLKTRGRAMESASGSSADPINLARRFAPQANASLGGLPRGDCEIDVLLTTDVLSEGQNLQDCRIVVNWDLPWTIIKVVQRAGRVDRVGQQAETIDVMSFLPQEGVEREIWLRRRLVERLKDSQAILGGDERFFDDDVVDMDITGLFDGTADLSEDEGEVDSASHAMRIWEDASDADREIAKNLPHVVFSTKEVKTGTPASVITYGRTDSGIDVLVRTTADGHSMVGSMEALRAMESVPDDLPVVPLHDMLGHVERATGIIKEQVKEKTLLVYSGLNKQLDAFLQDSMNPIDVPEAEVTRVPVVIDAITEYPLRDSVKKEVRSILRRSKKVAMDRGALLRQVLDLYDDGALVDERERDFDGVQIITEMGFNPRPTCEENKA